MTVYRKVAALKKNHPMEGTKQANNLEIGQTIFKSSEFVFILREKYAVSSLQFYVVGKAKNN